MIRRANEKLRVLTILVGTRPSALDPLATSDRPDEAFESAWRGSVKSRLRICFAIIALWTIGIEARLVRLQVVQHDRWLERAENQQQHVVKIAGKRGEIVDRN